MNHEHESPNALPTGTKLREYSIESVLGAGGFGIVYKARHRETGGTVAIKEYFPREFAARDGFAVVPLGSTSNDAFASGLDRFVREARQLEKFQALPGVVSVRTFFRANDTAYLVMNFEDGLPLSKFLAQREAEGNPFTEADLLDVIEPLLSALAVVHGEQVLHRDIKPENIFIRRKDALAGRPAEPVLIDFGAAKQNYLNRHVRFSRAPYTPRYAAYEQVFGSGIIGPWTDVYAMGALMWRMVAGGRRDEERLYEPDDTFSESVWDPNPWPANLRARDLDFGSKDSMPKAIELGEGRFSPHLLKAIDACLKLMPEDRVQNCEELSKLLSGRSATLGREEISDAIDSPGPIGSFESNSLFLSLDSATMADMIARARQRVCYAAPGIHTQPARALAALAGRTGPELISVCIDFDERVMRMGFGTLEALKKIQAADVIVRSAPGLRTGLLIIDDTGFIFTPTALYLETDVRTSSAPNAMRLGKDQIDDALARLSPASKAMAVAAAKTELEREEIREQIVEVETVEVTEDSVDKVSVRLDRAPPVDFDVARQVRVYTPYLQYVELSLTGAAIQRHRFAIPKYIQALGDNSQQREQLSKRLKTTFELIEKEGKLSSKPIEDRLNILRDKFAPSLGRGRGRVILKAQKPRFEEYLEEIKNDLEEYEDRLRRKLQENLDGSQDLIVEYYLPLVKRSPPDELLARSLTVGRDEKVTSEEAQRWLKKELSRKMPKPGNLIKKIKLDLRYKDVTYETLNEKEFIDAVKDQFPLDWNRIYEEFLAAKGPEA